MDPVLRQYTRARGIAFRGRGFGQGFFVRLAAQQRRALRQAIGDQQFVVPRIGVVRLLAQDEVHGSARGVLMQPLEERVLAVGARHAPHGGAGRNAGRAAVGGGDLAQRFHFKLLCPRHDVIEARIVGGDDQGVIPQHAAVGHAGQRHLHGSVVGDGGGAEMLVHGRGAGQQLVERIVAQRQRDRQADRRPQRVAAAHPVPDLKDVVGQDAQVQRRFDVGGDRHDLLDGISDPGLAQPVHRDFGIGQGLGGGERFRGDDDQRIVRVQPAHRIGHGMRVHIGCETHLAARAFVAQGAGDQPGAPVAAADSQVQHAAVAAGGIGLAHELAQAFAFGQHRLGHHRGRLGGAQGGVPCCPSFRPVGLPAVKQPRATGFEVLLREQGRRGGLQGGRLGLGAQVQAQPGSGDHA
ncbi:hypothetical protein D3C85_474260 [compost metagenome]